MFLMGDLRDWSPEVNGAASEGRPSSSSSSSPSYLSSKQPAIAEEYWLRAEEATQAIVAQVRPTVVSEERRKAVIDYVQGVIRNHTGCEVFAFGSVPLKTYLPDGDIDLTAFGGLHVDDDLANSVCSVLEKEDKNKTSEFEVKDVQLIRAEVKLVKCLVQNIVVDISFNQLGGLCTLCFLEQVDRLIGKDHLFKRSIILIKAWCYYESRILGAHHGLISTYALETLVLYIFHLFHSSLNGPLAVLYKFLDYFSKFDWESYCISLSGPIRISSLPEFVVETPENGGGDLLLSNDFLKDCVNKFSVPSRGLDTNSRAFTQKHLNIVDPLKENNNLGRSVSKGNFYRIRSAFTYGARKLGHILSQVNENVADELCKFFSNTLDRHGAGVGPDVQDLVPMSRYRGFGPSPLTSGSHIQVDQPAYDPESVNSSSIKVDYERQRVRMSGNNAIRTLAGPQVSASGVAVSENCFCGDARRLATFRIQNHMISNDSSKSASPAAGSVSAFGKMGLALDSNASCLSIDYNCDFEFKISENYIERNRSPCVHPSSPAESPVGPDHQAESLNSCPSLLSLQPSHSADPVSSGVSHGNCECFKTLSNLCGDYNSHLSSLQCGHCCNDYALNASVSQISTPLFSLVQRKKPWNIRQQSEQFRQNMISQVNSGALGSRPLIYYMNLNDSDFCQEVMPKPRGTGTYFPNVSHYKDGSLPGRGENLAPAISSHGNGVGSPVERKSPERRNSETLHVQYTAYHGGGNSGLSEYYRNAGKMFGNANGTVCHVDGVVEFVDGVLDFGTSGNLAGIVHSLESCEQPRENTMLAQRPSLTHRTPVLHSKEASDLEQDRQAIQLYHLKDEDDFPPLSDRPWKK